MKCYHVWLYLNALRTGQSVISTRCVVPRLQVTSLYLQTRNKELEETVGQLDALLLKYTSTANTSGGLISDEEYQTLKSPLVKRKNALENALNAQGEEQEEWMELSERTFNFARYARIWFEKGDDTTRRAILACLGSNLVLKDRKINVTLHPLFNSIVIHKEKIEQELVSARTSKKAPVKGLSSDSVPKNSSMLRG